MDTIAEPKKIKPKAKPPRTTTGPAFAADVPESILTDDTVHTTLLGDLNFFDGMPLPDTVEKLYDFLDLSRGVDAFLKGISATSVYAFVRGLREVGLQPGELGISETLLDARSLLLTPNTTTIYNFAELDLSSGPVVVELPAGVSGPVDDGFFRYVTDLGMAGPDQGRGGRYLFVHSAYEGGLPTSGYHIVRSPTYQHFFIFRAFIGEEGIDASVANVKDNFRMYPLEQAGNPPQQTFVNVSGMKFNTIHANDFSFYEELDEVIQNEPEDAFDPELLGIFAAIGIKKGQTFNPDDRMKTILTEAVAIGNAAARVVTFASRDPRLRIYQDRNWWTVFPGGNHEFLNDGVRMLDDRTLFHYYATGITPAMVLPDPGTGSVYEYTAVDSTGEYLNGSNVYKVTLPGPIPANDFWSFMVYSGQHRSFLETDQQLAGVDSKQPVQPDDGNGAYTIWFGPKEKMTPELESNWVHTWPGKSFHIILRLYEPTIAWFNGINNVAENRWKPGDVELVPAR